MRPFYLKKLILIPLFFLVIVSCSRSETNTGNTTQSFDNYVTEGGKKGNNKVEKFYSNNTITIGHFNHFVGDEGKATKIGVEAAVDYVNANKLIPNITLKVLELDVSGKIEDNIDKIESNLTEVAAWISASVSKDAIHAQNLTALHQTPIIYPFITRIDISLGLENVYQLIPDNMELAIYSILLSEKHKAKKIVIWEDPNDLYSVEYSRNYANLLSTYYPGAELLKYYQSKYKDPTMINEIVTDMAKLRPDAIFIPGKMNDVNTLVVAMSKSEITGVKVIMGDLGYLEDSNKDVFKDVNPEFIPPIIFVGYADLNLTSKNKTATAYMQKVFNSNPNLSKILLSLNFDTVILLAEGVKKLLENKKRYKDLEEFYKDYNKAIKSINELVLINSTVSVSQKGTNINKNKELFEYLINEKSEIELIGTLK